LASSPTFFGYYFKIEIKFRGVMADKLRNKKLIFLLTNIISTAILTLLSFDYIMDNFLFTFTVLTFMAFFSGSGGIMDNYIMELLGPKRQKEYGKIRLYNAVSWGVGCLIMGWISDKFGFHYNFILLIVMKIFYVILFAWNVPNRTN